MLTIIFAAYVGLPVILALGYRLAAFETSYYPY